MQQYEYTPGGTLLRSVTVLMLVYMAGAVIGVGSTMFEIAMLDQLAAGTDVPMEELESNDLRQALIGFLQTGIFVVLSILFLRSLSRANRNARALGASGMEFSPGWCIGWFFVPIMNLFKPYKAVREMWRASAPLPGPWESNPVSPIVGGWWTLWIICGIVGQAVFRLSLRAESLDEFRTASYVMLFSDVLDIPLSIIALMMLRRLYGMQEEKRERILAEPDSELGGRSCPSCGEALAMNDNICPMCGKEVTAVRDGW